MLFTSALQAHAAPDLTRLINLLQATPEGGWVRVNTNRFADAWVTGPDALPPSSTSNPGAVILAWSSFAWDPGRARIVLWGGGHANYMGNEVYIWQGDTGTWTRGSVSSRVEPYGSFAIYFTVDNAAPQSAHTYDNNVFAPLNDMFITFGGASFNSGGGFVNKGVDGNPVRAGPWAWDPRRADPSQVGGTTGSGYNPLTSGGQMWTNLQGRWTGTEAPSYREQTTAVRQENGRDVIYVTGDSSASGWPSLYRFELGDVRAGEMGRFEKVGVARNVPSYQGAGTIDSLNQIYIRTADVGGVSGFPSRLGVWDLGKSNTADPGANPDIPVDLVLPDGTPFDVTTYDGMDYDDVRNNVAIWDGFSGTVWVTRAARDTSGNLLGEWVVNPVPSSTVERPIGNYVTGVLGKWKFVRELGAFIALDNYSPTTGDAGVWLYKPVGWQTPGTGANTPPTVSLTSPANGTSVVAPASVLVSANAGDSDGTVSRVDFFAGATLIGSDTTAPYSLTWSNVAAGSYVLTAVAVDNGGASTTSSPVSITVTAPANVPPTVSLTSPANGTSVVAPASVVVSANAGDSDGTISRVDFFAGATLIGSDTTAPYSVTWNNVAAGSYVLTAVAVDNGGASTTSSPVSLTVTVSSAGGTVTLQDGLNGYTGTRDAYLSVYYPALNHGTMTDLLESGAYADLVRFAIFQSEGGPVPNGSTIVSATLSLYKASYYDYTYQVSRMLRDWDEAQVTWNQWRSGQSWSAAGAMGAGTDYASVADATVVAGWTPQWLSANVTTGVQAMAAGQPNNGWRLVRLSGNGNEKKFWSREYATDPTLRPKLVVQYASGGANTPPTVSLTSPANGTSVVAPASVLVSANAGDSDGTVSRVDFFAGATLIGSDTTAPYSLTWSNVAAGSYVLTAVAVDNGGASTTSSPVSITVTAPANVPPTVSLTSPANGTSVVAPASVVVSANAGDSDGTISRVDFFAGATLIGSDTTAPYSVTWNNVAAGSYVLTAVAVDNKGASTTSSPVGITVTAPANVPPTVSLTSPANGTSVSAPATVVVSANAGDSDGTVLRVDFYAGATLIGSDTTAPYSVTWSNVPAGTYVLTAVAVDNASASKTSAGVTLIVTAAPGGATVTLQDGVSGYAGTRDTYLSVWHTNVSFGTAQSLLEGPSYPNLLRFAIFQSEGGPVPNGATIVSATLSLYKSSYYDYTYQVSRILRNWDEAQATWIQWRNGQSWSVAGAKGAGTDYAATPDAVVTVGWTPQWLTANVTGGVQAMSSGTANYGWRLVDVSGNSNNKNFLSREYTGDLTLRPKLVVQYTVP